MLQSMATLLLNNTQGLLYFVDKKYVTALIYLLCKLKSGVAMAVSATL